MDSSSLWFKEALGEIGLERADKQQGSTLNRVLFTVIILFSCLASRGQAQVVNPLSEVPKPGEQTAVAAAGKAKAILALIGYDDIDIKEMQMSLVDFGPSARWWTCQPGDRSFLVLLSPTSLKLLALENQKKIGEQLKFQNRTGRPFYSDLKQAKDKILSYGLKLGMPKGTYVSKLKVVRDGEREGSNKGGYLSAELRDATGKKVAGLSCDIQDGVLISFSVS